MYPILLLLFISIPIIEIALIIQVGSVLGLGLTIALILITAIVGASLVRSQGLQTLMTLQQRLQKGELPAEQIIEGVMLAIAGVLLLTPGFVTDFLGMLLLVPWSRKLIMSRVKTIKFNHMHFGHTGFDKSPFDQPGNNTFEGEYEQKNNDKNRLN